MSLAERTPRHRCAGQYTHLCEGWVWLSARARGQRSLCLVTSWLGKCR